MLYVVDEDKEMPEEEIGAGNQLSGMPVLPVAPEFVSGSSGLTLDRGIHLHPLTNKTNTFQ